MRIVATFVSVLIAGTLSFTIGQEHMPSTDQLLKSLSLSRIPGLENFHRSSIKTEDIEKVVKERCEKNGGLEAYGVAKNSITSFPQCLQALVNVTELQTEIDEARPHGELDEVFKKYCRRVPNLKRCVRNVTDAIEPCLESEELDSIKNIHSITHSLLKFICHNEGDRIAMFIATGGIECFKAKQEAVGICASETFGGYVQAARPAGGAVPGLSSIPMLGLGLEQCRNIESFKTCTVGVLEECTDPTTANVVESLINFVQIATRCKALLEKPVDYTIGDGGFGSQPAAQEQHGEGYLPASFVSDTDEEESGTWGPWSAASSCSRSCGGGVAYQTRSCQEIDNVMENALCTGARKKFFTCNIQACPKPTQDFRAEQCAEFNNVSIEGVSYEWIPYTRGPNECELNCMPRGERFFYRHKESVTDGTPCTTDGNDVCVQGKCRLVGCDMMLGSDAKEDKCRECRGDGSACNTVQGLLDMNDLQVGYSDLLLIPAGATNIAINEVRPSNNYLAIRNTTGHYYLNGNWRIDFPRSLRFAGSVFHYERKPKEFSTAEIINTLGPTNEALYIVLLHQDTNVGVNYEYSIPKRFSQQSSPDSYTWVVEEFSDCSASCGGGFQSRLVVCVRRGDNEKVDSNLCDLQLEPDNTQVCGIEPCQPEWVVKDWGPCSEQCNSGGKQTRQIKCEQIISGGVPSIVDDLRCLDIVRPTDIEIQACNENVECPQWYIGRWKSSRLPVSTSNGSIGHTESSTSSVTPASQESVPHEKEQQSVKTTPLQADTRPNSFAGSGRQTSFENSWSKTSSAEPDNQYLPLIGGKCENERMREKYEKTKLELLELETNNIRDTGIQNSQLHELAMEKLSLEIERLKEARKYEQELYELQIKKIRLEIHAQELKTQVEA